MGSLCPDTFLHYKHLHRPKGQQSVEHQATVIPLEDLFHNPE